MIDNTSPCQPGSAFVQWQTIRQVILSIRSGPSSRWVFVGHPSNISDAWNQTNRTRDLHNEYGMELFI